MSPNVAAYPTIPFHAKRQQTRRQASVSLSTTSSSLDDEEEEEEEDEDDPLSLEAELDELEQEMAELRGVLKDLGACLQYDNSNDAETTTRKAFDRAQTALTEMEVYQQELQDMIEEDRYNLEDGLDLEEDAFDVKDDEYDEEYDEYEYEEYDECDEEYEEYDEEEWGEEEEDTVPFDSLQDNSQMYLGYEFDESTAFNQPPSFVASSNSEMELSPACPPSPTTTTTTTITCLPPKLPNTKPSKRTLRLAFKAMSVDAQEMLRKDLIQSSSPQCRHTLSPNTKEKEENKQQEETLDGTRRPNDENPVSPLPAFGHSSRNDTSSLFLHPMDPSFSQAKQTSPSIQSTLRKDSKLAPPLKLLNPKHVAAAPSVGPIQSTAARANAFPSSRPTSRTLSRPPSNATAAVMDSAAKPSLTTTTTTYRRFSKLSSNGQRTPAPRRTFQQVPAFVKPPRQRGEPSNNKQHQQPVTPYFNGNTYGLHAQHKFRSTRWQKSASRQIPSFAWNTTMGWRQQQQLRRQQQFNSNSATKKVDPNSYRIAKSTNFGGGGYTVKLQPAVAKRTWNNAQKAKTEEVSASVAAAASTR